MFRDGKWDQILDFPRIFFYLGIDILLFRDRDKDKLILIEIETRKIYSVFGYNNWKGQDWMNS
jgi:hypothetical protein